MTSVNPVEGSHYVRSEGESIIIGREAVAGSAGAEIQCKFVSNTIPHGVKTYIGFEYPDGSSLPFLPIQDVCIQKSPDLALWKRFSTSTMCPLPCDDCKRDYGDEFIHVSMPLTVYMEVFSLATAAYQSKRENPFAVSDSAILRRDGKAWFKCKLRPGADVFASKDGNSQWNSVKEALVAKDCDIIVDALFLVKVEAELFGLSTELCLELYGISNIQPHFGSLSRRRKPRLWIKSSSNSKKESQVVFLSDAKDYGAPLAAVKCGDFVSFVDGRIIICRGAILGSAASSPDCFLQVSDIPGGTAKILSCYYPDGSSLPFVPVDDVEILTEPYPKLSSREGNESESSDSGNEENVEYGKDYIHVSMPLTSYRKLFKKIQEAYEDSQGFRTDDSLVLRHHQTAWFRCNLKPCRAVKALLFGRLYKRTVQEALVLRGDDVGGVGLFEISFEKDPSRRTAEMFIAFYGLQLGRDINEIFGPFPWQEEGSENIKYKVE